MAKSCKYLTDQNDKGQKKCLIKEQFCISSYLNLRPSNPTHSRQVILQQKMVGFIIKAPLADGQVSPITFDLK